MEYIEKHPEKPWNWLGISGNPNITIKFIKNHLYKIDFKMLSMNKLTYQNKLLEQDVFWICTIHARYEFIKHTTTIKQHNYKTMKIYYKLKNGVLKYQKILH